MTGNGIDDYHCMKNTRMYAVEHILIYLYKCLVL